MPRELFHVAQRTMTPTNDSPVLEAARLLETAIRGIVMLPDELRIIREVSGPRVDWILQPAETDFGAIIGAKGSHLGALRLLAHRLGEPLEQHWRIESPDDGGRPPQFRRRIPIPTPEAHDHRADEQLLRDLISELRISAGVQAGPTSRAAFLFSLTPNSREAQASLLDPDPEDRSENLLAALGTIFRAMGRRQGVRYEVSLL